MSKLITTNFRKHMVEQFVDSLTEPANTIYYAFAGKSTPFDDDDNPPIPENSVNGTYYDLNREIVFGKRITPNDVKYMIRKNLWVTGTVYDPYNPDTIDLETKQFYVVTEENNTQSQTIDYSVFKCLNNNNDAVSTSKPIASEVTPDDEYYRTADGYEWKYMYTLTAEEYNKFATTNYIPIVENANVVANSVPGTIDAYRVDNAGVDYNSHASGYIKAGSLGGNNQIISLAGGTNVTLTLADATGFDFEKVTTDNDAIGVVVLLDPDSNKIQLGGISGSFTIGDLITGSTTSSTTTIQAVEYEIASLSANTDFYKGNSIYIRSGTGAGQIRDIVEYSVTGDERRVLIDDPFNITLDTTSLFYISPKVYVDGDGAGAKAIAVVNTALQNTIDRIEVIDRGYGYTYANVQIIANTGFIDFSDTELPGGQVVQAESAVVTPLLAPKGGHGSDAANELYSSRVGISIEFDQDEGGSIPTQNDYRKIGIMKEPNFANVELSISGIDSGASPSPTDFIDGETIITYNPRDTEVVLTSYSYDLARYETITLSDTPDTNIDVGETIEGVGLAPDLNFNMSGIVRSIQGNDILVKKNLSYIDKTFGDSVSIRLEGTEIVQEISSVANTYEGSSVVIENETGTSALDDFGRNFSFVEATSSLPIELVVEKDGLDITGNISANSTALDLSGVSITATDKIFAYVKSTSEVYSSLDIEVGATAEVSNRVPNLRLRNIRGDFNTNDIIYGLQSGTVAKIDAVDRTYNTFDNRYTFTVDIQSYGPGGIGFEEDELVIQSDSLLSQTQGYIHSINRNDGGDIVSLTLAETLGTFLVSDDASSSEVTLTGQTSGAVAKITGKVDPGLTKGSAEIIYIENVSPIERAATSTERLKLIIEF